MRPAPDVGAAARAVTRLGRIIAGWITLVSPAATDRPFAQPANWCVFLRRGLNRFAVGQRLQAAMTSWADLAAGAPSLARAGSHRSAPSPS